LGKGDESSPQEKKKRASGRARGRSKKEFHWSALARKRKKKRNVQIESHPVTRDGPQVREGVKHKIGGRDQGK